MKKQAIVVGLGQFGMSVARELVERGVEVLAVDNQQDRVRVAGTFATDAACFDATDADALSRTAPENREVCVCAIGDEAKDASIICTALLRQMGAKRVIARADDDVHVRILRLVGAHQVVNPEREFGERFASQIIHEGIVGELSLGGGLLVTEFTLPDLFAGQTLAQLRLPRRFGVTVVAVRRPGEGKVQLPNPTEPLSHGENLIVVAHDGAVDRLMEQS